jgi:hypothetical protein
MGSEPPPSGDAFDDDEDFDVARRQCVDCHTLAPPTNTAHTLISAAHGWRLHRRNLVGGKVEFEWRCPKCWLAFKRTRLGAP